MLSLSLLLSGCSGLVDWDAGDGACFCHVSVVLSVTLDR